MAKKIIIPPKKNIGATVKNIVKQGAKTQPTQTLNQGKTRSFTQQVQKSRIPTPSQNQRGRIKSKSPRDLTR